MILRLFPHRGSPGGGRPEPGLERGEEGSFTAVQRHVVRPVASGTALLERIGLKAGALCSTESRGTMFDCCQASRHPSKRGNHDAANPWQIPKAVPAWKKDWSAEPTARTSTTSVSMAGASDFQVRMAACAHAGRARAPYVPPRRMLYGQCQHTTHPVARDDAPGNQQPLFSSMRIVSCTHRRKKALELCLTPGHPGVVLMATDWLSLASLSKLHAVHPPWTAE